MSLLTLARLWDGAAPRIAGLGRREPEAPTGVLDVLHEAVMHLAGEK